MITLLTQIPALCWFLTGLGFLIHLCLKAAKGFQKAKKNKTFWSLSLWFTDGYWWFGVTASLLMSIGMLLAADPYFTDEEFKERFFPLLSLGIGYFNNSLFTNIMQVTRYTKFFKSNGDE